MLWLPSIKMQVEVVYGSGGMVMADPKGSVELSAGFKNVTLRTHPVLGRKLSNLYSVSVGGGGK